MATSLQRQRYPKTRIKQVVEFANSGDLGALEQVLLDRSHVPSEGEVAALRARVVVDLDAIAEGRELPPATIRRLELHAAGIGIKPVRFQAETREMFLEYKAATVEALTSYITWQLYQARLSAGHFPGDLCRCQLDSCQRFYFALDRVDAQGGRPPTKFCSREHMLVRHAQTSAERVARHRRNKAAAAKHK